MAKTSSFSYAFLSEILSAPRIKPLVQRLHPSAVLSVLKSAFDDVSQELWLAVNEQRRPDVNELIERIVGRLASLLDIAEPLVLDARGRLFTNDYERLAPAAVEEGAWIVSEPKTDYSIRQDELREKDVRLRLARLAGAESAAIFPSLEAARAAVLQALLNSGRSLVVARRDLYETDSGYRLENAFDAFPTLSRREVGACNSASVEDYRRACDETTGLVWRVTGRWTSEGRRADSEEIAALKGEDGRSFLLLGDVDFAPLIDLSEFFDTSILTIADRFKKGFDFILCDGAQLIGGPSCGLLFGPRAKIETILETPIARYAQTSRVTLAILAKTLSFYDNRETALESIPVLRMLSTSQANLESRAKRLADLLETVPCVQIARVVEGRSTLCANMAFGTSPTRLVEVKLRGFSPAEIAAKLETTSPKLLLRWTRDSVLIDMKTLLPEQDVVAIELVERLAKKDAASES